MLESTFGYDTASDDSPTDECALYEEAKAGAIAAASTGVNTNYDFTSVTMRWDRPSLPLSKVNRRAIYSTKIQHQTFDLSDLEYTTNQYVRAYFWMETEHYMQSGNSYAPKINPQRVRIEKDLALGGGNRCSN